MTTEKREDVSRSDQEIIADLTQEIARLSLEKEQCHNKEKELRGKEDVSKGIFFASEIYELQQDRLRLEVEIDLRRKKIRRMELGFEEPEHVSGTSEGFAF